MFELPTFETSVVNPYDNFSNFNFTCNTKPVYRWRQHKLHTCRKCQAHGITTSLKGHVNCPNKNCACLQCSHISTQRIEAVIRKRRRKTLVRLEEAHHTNVQQNSINIQQAAQSPNIQLPSMDWINLLYLVNYLQHPSSMISSL
uniref:DM domain-containing protein n=1 Tax=Acrobeloides nanus TaxID=290746 RepID=A0A914ENJ6_9BILA